MGKLSVMFCAFLGHWGNGYAFEVTSALTAYAFDVIGLDRL
ncbi:hypothetical protein [Brevibacillus formosus]